MKNGRRITCETFAFQINFLLEIDLKILNKEKLYIDPIFIFLRIFRTRTNANRRKTTESLFERIIDTETEGYKIIISSPKATIYSAFRTVNIAAILWLTANYTKNRR